MHDKQSMHEKQEHNEHMNITRKNGGEMNAVLFGWFLNSNPNFLFNCMLKFYRPGPKYDPHYCQTDS